jgi:hypothetical protein
MEAQLKQEDSLHPLTKMTKIDFEGSQTLSEIEKMLLLEQNQELDVLKDALEEQNEEASVQEEALQQDQNQEEIQDEIIQEKDCLSQSLDLSLVSKLLADDRARPESSQNSLKNIPLTQDSFSSNVNSLLNTQLDTQQWLSKIAQFGKPEYSEKNTIEGSAEEENDDLYWLVEHQEGFWLRVEGQMAEAVHNVLESLPNYWSAAEWNWEKKAGDYHGLSVWAPIRK